MLHEIAKALVAPGKGILAADESGGTIKKRFDAIGVESTEENRRAYRDLLFTAEGAEEWISGVILYDETIRQASADGTPFPKLLERKGIIPGIKVDKGAKQLANATGETITEGLDGLRERFEEYRALGARFAKWRGVYSIGPGRPSEYAVWTNAHALARYAALAQEAGLVPIVEPEVLEGMLLKPNMVLSGYECPVQADVATVAEQTIRCLRHHVPAAVPGIVFLSGGQSDELATEHLNAIDVLGPQPWELSFSYGRALQAAAQQAWRGLPENVAAAQQAYLHRARMNGLARDGHWTPDLERAA